MAETTTLPLELRRSADDHVLEGLAVPYGRTSLKAGYARGERFLKGAFAGACNPRTARNIRLTDVHDRTGKRPVGVATELRESDQGLHATFRFYNTPEGRGAWENVIEQTYGGLSIGFTVPAGGERRAADGAREVIDARLFHVSLVDEPAYEEARIIAVRHALPDVSDLVARTYKIEDFPDVVDLSMLTTRHR